MSKINITSEPIFTVSAPPFWHCGRTIQKNNFTILIALLPIIFMAIWNWGLPAARVIALAGATGILTEAAWKKLLHQQLDIDNFSSLIACILFSFLLPAAAPGWIVILGAIITVILGKMIFGGIGSNPINSSLVGWAVLYVSWSTFMDPNSMQLYTNLTDPLFRVKYFGIQELNTISTMDLLLGKQIGGLGSTQNLAIIVGGLYLLIKGIIRYEIPLSFLIGITCTASVFYMINPEYYAPPIFHILTGSTLLGAFFLATDTASSPNRAIPMTLYGLLGGIIVMIIRIYGIYLDGVPFAILLINFLTPQLNMIRPKPFGVK